MKPFKLPLYFWCNVFGEIREMLRWVNASLFLVLWAFSVRDNEQTLCFIINQLEFVWRQPCLYIWNAIMHASDWGVCLICCCYQVFFCKHTLTVFLIAWQCISNTCRHADTVKPIIKHVPCVYLCRATWTVRVPVTPSDSGKNLSCSVTYGSKRNKSIVRILVPPGECTVYLYAPLQEYWFAKYEGYNPRLFMVCLQQSFDLIAM